MLRNLVRMRGPPRWDELSPKVGDGGNRKRHIVGVLDASTSPPKVRYAVSEDNIIKLLQPRNVATNSPKSCVLGRVPCWPMRSRPRSRTFSASMPI
jgi:hypothetical protein